MDIRALFSDETGGFRIPLEPEINDHICVKFRTAINDADSVVLVLYRKDSVENIEMHKVLSDARFDFYEAGFEICDTKVHYHFIVTSGENKIVYNKLGVCKVALPEYDFKIMPGFKTPDWAKGAVIYQIFVDRFANGDKSNDVRDNEYIYINNNYVKKIENWYEYPSALDVSSFYGGDLQGVMDKLDYLKKLGVEVIYFNPLFVSPSNHKYDTQDYDYIDPHIAVISKDVSDRETKQETNRESFRYIERVCSKENLEASNEFFAQLVTEIHKRGMKVILDGVFNHCGSFNKWMDRERIYEGRDGYESGAYISADSIYRDYFDFKKDDWPYNGSYDGWWGFDTLPKLNYENSDKLCEYILDVGRKWVSPPYNADGWRLDVAADLGHSETFNHEFWQRFREAVKSANPDAIILAEHYGDPSAWLSGNEWDTVMNYDAFMEPVSWFLTGMEKHSDKYIEGLLGNSDYFFESMNRNMSKFYIQSLLTSMNELSNHDHSRFLTRTNRTVGRTADKGPEAAEQNTDKAVLREAVVIMMTWPGAPTIYYGDEAGLCGWTDPDNRRTYPWGKEDFELIDFHRYMIDVHRRSKAIKKGAFKELLKDYNIISYGRFDDSQKIIVAVNNNDDTRSIEIPVWEIGVPDNADVKRLIMTEKRGYNAGTMIYHTSGGRLTLEMPPESAMVFRYEEE